MSVVHSASCEPLAPAVIELSVVVPVYGNQDTLPALISQLRDLTGMVGIQIEAVFVVDGSPDGSLLVLRRLLPDCGFPAQLISHSRNFGSFAAVRTGFAAARGRFVAVIAADLQEPPELLVDFYRTLSQGEVDVVVGRREHRQDPFLTRISSAAYWALYRRFILRELPPGGVDVFGCTRPVAERLLTLNESHTSLVGLLYWLGFRRAEVTYIRQPRRSGRSGWSWRRRIRYLLDSIYSFTDVPVTLLVTAGLVGGILTLTASVVVFVARVTGVIHQAGYTPIMLVVLLSTFTLLFGLGVVGSYVWRTYENSKGRPSAVPMSHEVFEPSADAT